MYSDFQEAWTVITLTLTAGAVKLNVLPTAMDLVTGANKLGVVGVLLAVAFPVNSCKVAFAPTCLKGKTKVKSAGAESTFEI